MDNNKIVSYELPEIIMDTIILKYSSIHANKYINKYYENKRQIIMNNSLKKIKIVIIKYMLIRRYDIDYYVDSYYIPKKYWKKYYPLCERKNFLKLVINQNNLRNKQYIINIYNDFINNSSKNLTITFNKIIDLLDQNELFEIGW